MLEDRDVCCNLYGSHVLFMLRKLTDERFRLIGKAYIEGLLDEFDYQHGIERDFVVV